MDLPIVGADHKDTAELAAEWIATKIGGKGQIAVVQGLPTAEAARLRTDCFVDYIKANYPDIEVVATQNADWDRTKAKDVSATILKQYPDLKAIYANNDTMAMGVLESVKEADLLGKCLVVGTDGTSEALDSVKAGELSATINDFPFYQSQVAAEMLVRKLSGQDVPEKIYSPHAVVDADNCNPVSYTHLDVYKRQAVSKGTQRNRAAPGYPVWCRGPAASPRESKGLALAAAK